MSEELNTSMKNRRLSNKSEQTAQQNDKKMLKLLLRRGADINAQNSTGNTALHYTNEYKFTALTEYILNKGGNDTLLNMKGLTCYEGVNGVS